MFTIALLCFDSCLFSCFWFVLRVVLLVAVAIAVEGQGLCTIMPLEQCRRCFPRTKTSSQEMSTDAGKEALWTMTLNGLSQ